MNATLGTTKGCIGCLVMGDNNSWPSVTTRTTAYTVNIIPPPLALLLLPLLLLISASPLTLLSVPDPCLNPLSLIGVSIHGRYRVRHELKRDGALEVFRCHLQLTNNIHRRDHLIVILFILLLTCTRIASTNILEQNQHASQLVYYDAI